MLKMDCISLTTFDGLMSIAVSTAIMIVTLTDIYIIRKIQSLEGCALDPVDALSQRWFGRWWLLRLAAFTAISVAVIWPQPRPISGMVPFFIAIGALFINYRRARKLQRAD